MGRDVFRSKPPYLGPLISIHAPRMGRDPRWSSPVRKSNKFQSTRPAWGATANLRLCRSLLHISIHAPRMGRDIKAGNINLLFKHFNPRAPHGARRRVPLVKEVIFYFNPRAPHGARQKKLDVALIKRIFQSTRPAWGATFSSRIGLLGTTDFNPRAPHGARQESQIKA